MGLVKRAAVVLTIACVFCLSGRADGVLTSVGPTSAQTNFPLYYSDAGGLALELCLTPPDAGPPCFFDPVIAGNALSEATGFGGEGFWFLAESSIATPTVTGLLVMAVEAAYGAGDPAPNDQISFARVRIRIDVPDATPGGTYTVTYPYGVKVYSDVPGCTTDPVGGTCPNIVNETVDVGVGAPGVFTGALAGEIGPFLTMDPLDPNYAAITALYPGYIGDLNTPVAVVGSPLGTNYFRIQGPGGIDVQQPLFTLMGKLFTGNIPTPLVIESATYTRNAVPGSLWHMEVFAASAPSAVVTVEGAGFLARPMSGDGAGGFFSYIPMLGATGLPSTVTLTADNSATVPTNIPTVMSAPVTDMVTITKALYNVGLKELTIEAFSSDQAVPPILAATGFTTLTGGSLIISPITPPATVEVVSSAGGRDVRAVDILPLPFFASLDAGPGPLLINFIDLSSNNPTGWLWDFGDGTTSTEQNPVHMYATPGSYTITLTTTTAGGQLVTTALNYITVVAGSCPNGPARVFEAATDWAFLQLAYNNALDTNSIRLLAVTIPEALDFNLPKSVNLLGGFDCQFQADLGMTTISGSLTISSGTATIDKITIL